jgi:hypothetical protein
MASSLSTLVYGPTIAKLINGTHAWGTGTWKASLVLSDDTSTKESDFREDCSEATGQTAQTVTCTAAAASGGTVTVDVSDATITFSGVTGSQTVSALLIYLAVSGPSADPVLVLLQFTGSDIAADGVNDIVITPGTGVLTGSY